MTRLSLDDPVSKYLPEFKTLWVQDKGGVKTALARKSVILVKYAAFFAAECSACAREYAAGIIRKGT